MPPSEKSKKRILIAEDERAYSRALVLKLQNSGFYAESVPNGEEALSLIERSHFDLLVCDLIMPIVNGFEVLERLQKKNNKIPILVLSNLSQEEDEKKARSLGATDFISKSDTPIAEVIRRVEQLFQKK
ncbi:MAG: hypothetical protein A2845_02645 [Candidatus Lloydbacteria bacterium RIFCSPHIGHO2_01_FULL_49_22]|uniref:Response regulatory domain-containing protein n=1 Tax=Candidatus Lloydbacteria bacterium RIFCSPHIGHO2_01_FULL_49_22 TaxID=1798658 RepID=A0A1G2CV04_9BACT|nr:MAG: hypothetical protein A2845_02645 [Candidatus Lloydbacteria bacterium RIFCSPHIGHO2_01_FULL_49_22]OGZ10347.1 MAG: hypothetical protein A3C14_02345 [Candidatus Lloydbacteria bacterium RIFCSPHIGHO2_02_FULL_50_18]